ncbi:MAG: hypothetical protein DRO95_05370 [Candidatus Altiarchaeales archaeon]|nr:MAG: hypothetical protein DRO95_05370 [Candidatus Altiarchaeales archaeon]
MIGWKRGRNKGKRWRELIKSCQHYGQTAIHNLYPLSIKDIDKCNLEQFDAWIILESAVFSALEQLDSRRLPILFFNIPDGDPPTDSQMHKILDFAQSYSKVLISCYGAHGRTGTVLAIYLHLKDPKPEDPILRIRREYCEKAVETIEQALFVYDFLNLEPDLNVLNSLKQRWQFRPYSSEAILDDLDFYLY